MTANKFGKSGVLSECQSRCAAARRHAKTRTDAYHRWWSLIHLGAYLAESGKEFSLWLVSLDVSSCLCPQCEPSSSVGLQVVYTRPNLQ